VRPLGDPGALCVKRWTSHAKSAKTAEKGWKESRPVRVGGVRCADTRAELQNHRPPCLPGCVVPSALDTLWARRYSAFIRTPTARASGSASVLRQGPFLSTSILEGRLRFVRCSSPRSLCLGTDLTADVLFSWSSVVQRRWPAP